jgi:hypothetical protein
MVYHWWGVLIASLLAVFCWTVFCIGFYFWKLGKAADIVIKKEWYEKQQNTSTYKDDYDSYR